jgi:hypothetical protein
VAQLHINNKLTDCLSLPLSSLANRMATVSDRGDESSVSGRRMEW